MPETHARTSQGHDARSIANALISRGIDAAKPRDPLQVIKLTYLCHGWMLGLYHRPMSKQAVEAWQYGPVIPVVYHGVKRFGRNPVTSPIARPFGPPLTADFDEFEEDLIEQVFSGYIEFSGIDLSMMTHAKGTPWDIIWHREGRSAEIPDPLIEEHFAAAATADHE